jgi:hypothetical protein
MSLIPGEPPLSLIPTIEHRQFVPWLTAAEIDIIDEVDFGSDVMLVAHPLVDALAHPRLARKVRRGLALGLLLEPEVYLLQLPKEVRADFERETDLLLEARDGEHLDLERKRTPGELAEFSHHILDLEVRGLATALLAPAPLLRDGNATALDNALALLEVSADYFAAEGLETPADADLPFRPRQLLASLTLDVRLLREPTFLRRVLDAYVEPPQGAYGFVVQVANLSSRPVLADVRSLSEVLYNLQHRSGLPVIVARVGNLGLGYLAGGLAGYSLGNGVSELLTFPPLVYSKNSRDQKDGKKRGFSLVAFHGPLLRNLQTIGRYDTAGLRAFHRLPCPCGRHEFGKAPRHNKAKKLHGFWWRIGQARSAAGEGSVRWLRKMIDRAELESASIDGEVAFYAALRETLPEAAEVRLSA